MNFWNLTMQIDTQDKKFGFYKGICILFVLNLFCFNSAKLFAQHNDSLFVKEIYISGNKLTRPHVIYREINIKKGEFVLKKELKARLSQSEKFLFNTHLFLADTITDSIHNNEVSIYIKVKERIFVQFWQFQFKAADRDINVWLRKPSLYRLTYGILPMAGNFTGQNDRLTVSAIFGWRQTYQLDYRFPYLNKDKTLGLENIIYYQQGHEIGALTVNNQLDYLRVDQNYLYHKTGWESDLIYRKRYQVTHTLVVGFDYYNISNTVRDTNPDYLGDNRNIIRVPRLAYKFVYDKRNYAFYATEGDLINFSIEHDGLPVLLKDVNVTTTDLTYRKFIPLGGRFYYQGGFTSEYDFQSFLPYVFKSATSLGYRYDVTGFENYIIDGRAYFITDNELKFLVFSRLITLPHKRILNYFNPLPANLYLKIYTQQGGAFYNPVVYNNNLENKLLNGFGFGVDFVTYYDFVMRVEYSFNNLGKSGLFFHFTEVF